jgi:hypothetical protein
MFRADAKPDTPKPLYLVVTRREGTDGKVQGEKTMNTYKFADLPSNSFVASLVTLLVAGWFLIAAGAILSDPPSIYTQRSQMQTVQAPIDVEASRNAVAIAPAARHTILVVAKRAPAAASAITL